MTSDVLGIKSRSRYYIINRVPTFLKMSDVAMKNVMSLGLRHPIAHVCLGSVSFQMGTSIKQAFAF